MKVTLGDFGKEMPTVQSERTEIDQRAATKNRFTVLEVADDDEVHVVTVRRVEDSEEGATCGMEVGMAQIRDQVRFVSSVGKRDGWASLGVGDIIVDSAAGGSCWPLGEEDAYPTKESRMMMLEDCEWRRHAACWRKEGDVEVHWRREQGPD